MPLKTGRDYPDQTANRWSRPLCLPTPQGTYQSYLVAWFPDFETRITTFSPFQLCQGSVETGCEQGASQSQGFYYSDRMNNLIRMNAQNKIPARKKILPKFKTSWLRMSLCSLMAEKEYALSKTSPERYHQPSSRSASDVSKGA